MFSSSGIQGCDERISRHRHRHLAELATKCDWLIYIRNSLDSLGFLNENRFVFSWLAWLLGWEVTDFLSHVWAQLHNAIHFQFIGMYNDVYISVYLYNYFLIPSLLAWCWLDGDLYGTYVVFLGDFGTQCDLRDLGWEAPAVWWLTDFSHGILPWFST